MPFEKELIPYLLLNFISFMDHLATERLSSMLLITIYQKPFYKQKGMLGNVNIYCILFETTEQRLSTLPLQLILDAWASPSFFLFFLFLSLLVQIVLWTFMRNVISSNSSPSSSSPSPLIQLLPKRQQEFLQREPASFSPTPLSLSFYSAFAVHSCQQLVTQQQCLLCCWVVNHPWLHLPSRRINPFHKTHSSS